MTEMVGSAVVQEAVSGLFSFMRNNHEEMAAQNHLIERLKYAHFELKFALERTKRMPMIEVSLLQRRMMIKHAFEESCDLLCKQHTLRVNREEEGAEEQGVTLYPSLPNRVMHAVKPFFGIEKGSISESCVRRFELFAEKTDKFVRDVESGFSLALYRFSCSLVTQLLEGKHVCYAMASRSRTCMLSIHPYFIEDYGAVAIVNFEFKDRETPMKCFRLRLMLRLSESTDIVGISTKCLQSLEPQFKPVADVASGELAQISTQVRFFQPEPACREFMFNLVANAFRYFRREPLCCIGHGFRPSAKNILPSELTERFPEEVRYLLFECFISATEYNLLSSTAETNRNTMKASPILQMSVFTLPHYSWKPEDDKGCTYLVQPREKTCEPLYCLGLSEIAKVLPVLAVHFSSRVTMLWCSGHGTAAFNVSKPTTEMGCGPKRGNGCKTRRASKRKR